MKIRRINLFGAPGSGKSSTASMLFYNLKARQYSAELVTEYIKMWTYIPRKPISWDSFYCQAKQITREDIILRGNIELIVSDSPIFMQYFYAWHHGSPGQEAMLTAHMEFEETYPSLNLFIKRPKGVDYDGRGRYEDSNESEEISKKMVQLMLEHKICYRDFHADEEEEIKNYVFQKLR